MRLSFLYILLALTVLVCLSFLSAKQAELDRYRRLQWVADCHSDSGDVQTKADGTEVCIYPALK